MLQRIETGREVWRFGAEGLTEQPFADAILVERCGAGQDDEGGRDATEFGVAGVGDATEVAARVGGDGLAQSGRPVGQVHGLGLAAVDRGFDAHGVDE